MIVTDVPPTEVAGRTMAGSFGMPSLPPELWRDDLVRARAAVREGQVLIVSVVGTADAATTETAFVDDFARLAREVSDLGAHAVEANLSCPNVGKREGEVYRDPALVGRIARAIRSAVPDKPLLLKLGEIRDAEHIDAVVDATAGIADALVLANAPARRVIAADGSIYFGIGREQAGITGAAIKPLALAAIRMAGEAIARRRVRMALVGVGGIVVPADVREFIESGACAGLSVTGATLDPMLALDVKTSFPEI
jgi:dihydroorotate dehydrogenase